MGWCQPRCLEQKELLVFCQSDSNSVKSRYDSQEATTFSYRFIDKNYGRSNFTYNETDSILTFLLIDTVRTSGQFGILTGGIYCWSIYSFGDQFYFEEQCQINDNEYCDGPYTYYSSHSRQYCLGDTTKLKITNTGWENGWDKDPTLINPIDPSRFSFPNARIIEIDSNSISVIWDKEGEDCITISTEVLPGCTNTMDYKVRVLPKENIQIYNEYGSIDSTVICVGESVNLYIENSTELNSKWEISDGRVYHGLENEITFQNPGTYEIWIYDENQIDHECGCSSGSRHKVIVVDGSAPSIDCKRTVCLGESITYYSSLECSTYLWNIGIGGLIVEGGSSNDSYVTVEWNSTQATDVTLTTPACLTSFCSESVTETMKVISATVEIIGAQSVCGGDFVTYSAPAFNGTNFVWDVSPYGQIISGNETNRIQVRWLKDNVSYQGKVKLSYENCNIECNGYAELEVAVKLEYSIDGFKDGLCIGEDYIYRTIPQVDVDWTLIDPMGVTTSFTNSDNISLSLNDPGSYLLKSSNNSGTTCNKEDSLFFEVNEDVFPFGFIDGPNIICIGDLSQYSYDFLSGFETIIWNISDGDSHNLIDTSRTLNYIWESNGPYQFEITILNTLTGCTSIPLLYAFNNLPNIIGEDEVCLGEVVKYTLPEFYANSVVWTLPLSAGTIVEQKEDFCKIIWINEGIYNLEAEYCGKILEIEVNVNSLPSPVINYQEIICSGALSNLEITSNPNDEISIFDIDGNLISTSNNMEINYGNYTILLESEYGCTFTERIRVDTVPDFEITISTFGNIAVCSPFAPITFEIDDPISNYSYEWVQNGITHSSTSNSILADELGWYYVIATDIYGCVDTSNVLSIVECCGNEILDSINIDNPTMTNNGVGCDTWEFEINPPYQSTNFTWSFGDPNSLNNTASGFTAGHTYTKAGYYGVTAYGNGQCQLVNIIQCGLELEQEICETVSTNVTIPLVSDFEFVVGCAGDPISFIDKSTAIGSTADIIYQWDFGDLGSSTNESDLSSPMHTYENEGQYEVILIGTLPNGCTSTKSKTLDIKIKPQIQLFAQNKACLGSPVDFTAISSHSDLDYEWDFDDPSSGSRNISFSNNTVHLFSRAGIFIITLRVNSKDGCTQTITNTIEILPNDIDGIITSDILEVKCPQDIAMLTAPGGNFRYLWSTGDTSRTISTIEAGEYTVSLINEAECEVTLEPYSIVNQEMGKTRIRARSSSSTWVYDTISICEGEWMYINAVDIYNAKYEWTDDLSNTTNINSTHFRNLTPGTYSYSVTVTDQSVGCQIEDGPIIVIVHPELERPSILTDDSSCEGQINTLRVDPYDVNHTYLWSNGEEGESISVTTAAYYYVTVTNEIGCSEKSMLHIVRDSPGTNEWMTGCMEVCFPREICINLNTSNSYQLLQNGASIGTVNSSLSSMDITEPGDYQLLVTNQYGCQSMSDMLSLSATPEDQTLDGIVYLDDNENGEFDSTDILQAGVTIYLMNGNTIIETTSTDVNGYYFFDPVPQSNLRAVIDPESVNFIYEGQADSTLLYYDCVEDKIIDFPLISICGLHLKIDTLYTCPGIPVSIDGVLYSANESDTVIVNLYEQCDSLYIRNVLAYTDPIIDLSVTPRCDSEPNGQLEIDNLLDENLSFSLSENFETEDSLFTDLDAGIYLLFVKNESGCIYQFPFEIEQRLAPEIAVVTQQTCLGNESGVLSIDVVVGEQLLFSMDQDSSFTDQQIFSGLSEGAHSIFVQDTAGCLYVQEVNITSYLEPSFDTNILQACEGHEYGELNIDVTQGNPLFAIDDYSSFSTDVDWDIGEGAHMLYVQSEFGCLDSVALFVDLIAMPIVELTTIHECENINLGALNILNETENLMLSIDGFNFSSVLDFPELEAGEYILYSQTVDGCVFESPFEILEYQEPSLTLNTLNTCQNENGGQLVISEISSANLQFSYDGISFQEDTLFSNLSSGDYFLYVEESGSDCSYQYPFSIEQIDVPEVVIVEEGTCTGTNEGSINISSLAGEGLTYDIYGNGVFVSETYYSDLPSGEYSILIKDTLGCIYEEMIDIETYQSADFSVEVTSSCTDQSNGSLSITLDTGEATFALGSPFNYTQETEYADLASGFHTIYSKSNNGCLDSMIINIPSNVEPVVELDIQHNCEGISLGQLNLISSFSGLEYSIDGSVYMETNSIEDLNNGVYILYYKTEEGCFYEKYFEVLLIEEPSILLDIHNTCEGSSEGVVTLIDVSVGLEYSLDGIAFDSIPTFSQLSIGNYEFWAKNEYSCIYKYPFEIMSLPLPSIEVVVDDSCENIDNGSLDILTIIENTEVSINGEVFSSEKTLTGLSQGMYDVVLRDLNMCETDTTVEINSLPRLEVSLDVEDLECFEQSVTLVPEVHSSFGDVMYLWSDESILPFYTASMSGEYAVTVSDYCDEKVFFNELEIFVFSEDMSLLAPNIFSPNGDGVNDCFQALSDFNLDVVGFNISIFDRWGNLMFDTDDQYDCWDGKYKNSEVVSGVYVYMMSIEINQCVGMKSISKVGDVTVIR